MEVEQEKETEAYDKFIIASRPGVLDAFVRALF